MLRSLSDLLAAYQTARAAGTPLEMSVEEMVAHFVSPSLPRLTYVADGTVEQKLAKGYEKIQQMRDLGYVICTGVVVVLVDADATASAGSEVVL